MGAVLLDSTVVIDLLRRRPGAIGRLQRMEAAGDIPHVCAVTVEEVTRGLQRREDDAVIDLLEALSVAPLGVEEGRLAGYWRRTFAKRGRTLHQADCLIAAAAVGIDARLATGNRKDFPMKGLQVEDWPLDE
jgi:predicted nucleic acid-binding protein